jgi:hypothetical protein
LTVCDAENLDSFSASRKPPHVHEASYWATRNVSPRRQDQIAHCLIESAVLFDNDRDEVQGGETGAVSDVLLNPPSSLVIAWMHCKVAESASPNMTGVPPSADVDGGRVRAGGGPGRRHLRHRVGRGAVAPSPHNLHHPPPHTPAAIHPHPPLPFSAAAVVGGLRTNGAIRDLPRRTLLRRPSPRAVSSRAVVASWPLALRRPAAPARA